MVADQLDLVVGVDTHLDEHVLAIVAAPSGARVAQRAVPATARGYAAALRCTGQGRRRARLGDRALPRSGERREALRLLLVARRSAVDVRREALAQLRGVIVTAPDQLREELRTLPAGRLRARCSRLRRSRVASADELATRLVLRSLAR